MESLKNTLMDKFITIDEAVSKIKDGMSIMIGGFLAGGTPEKLVDAIVKAGIKDLTIIGNDTGFPDKGIGKLVVSGQVKRVIVSHIGTNPTTSELMNAGKMEVTFVPQGTLAEQVRAGGAGLGGVLTSTGLGTIVAEGKEVITVDGKEYLLEKPIRADVALILANKADKMGNLFYKGTSQNFNPLMAMAADLVIAQVEEVVEVGEIEMEDVRTSYIFVDYMVK